MFAKLSYGERLGQGMRKSVGTGLWKKRVEVFSVSAFHLSLRQRKCFKVLEKNIGTEKVKDGLVYSFI